LDAKRAVKLNLCSTKAKKRREEK
jgi:hypothetical protein